MKKNLILTLLLFSVQLLFSQSYYGKDDFGRLEFINDSNYVVSFYSHAEGLFFDTGTYYKIKDTIFLNSMKKEAFVFEEVDEKDNIYMDSANGCDYNLMMKFFYLKNKKYEMSKECTGSLIYYDNINKEIKTPFSVHKDDIVVIFDGMIYKRFIPRPSKEYPDYPGTDSYRIKIVDDKDDRVYLNDFPLLIRGNKLIPIDKNKNYDCWVNNGFYFPKMKRNEKRRKREAETENYYRTEFNSYYMTIFRVEYRTKSVLTRGVRGLTCCRKV
ncbi:MAG: hypothetical protein IJ213_10030 [Bacteroidales bacterium]|nr:hypothetical protein [Bacteroidales bacterium]